MEGKLPYTGKKLCAGQHGHFHISCKIVDTGLFETWILAVAMHS